MDHAGVPLLPFIAFGLEVGRENGREGVKYYSDRLPGP
jgi:hypothetical protein